MTQLAELKLQLERVKKRLELYELAVHDLTIGAPSRVGMPLKVRLRGVERPGNSMENQAGPLIATVLRPNGAWPIVLIQDFTGPGMQLGGCARVVAESDWMHEADEAMSLDYRLLRDRVRSALYKFYREGEKEGA